MGNRPRQLLHATTSAALPCCCSIREALPAPGSESAASRCPVRVRGRKRLGRGFPVARVRATTILAVRHNGKSAIGGDGQVTLGNVVMKGDARKIRPLYDGKVLVGFAGAAADAFALLERFETKLKDFQGSVPRAGTELAKEWRMDRMLRRLEAMLVAVDREHLLIVGGTGDVIQPTDGIAAIGSGGAYALAAARALAAHSPLTAAQIVRTS